VRAYVKYTYQRTQADLKAAGIKEVYLARGVKNAGNMPIGRGQVRLNALSSFTRETGYAASWAKEKYPDSRVVVMKVPASRIFSTARTGLGVAHEDEWVVLGGKGSKALVIKSFNFRSAKHRELVRQRMSEALKSKKDLLEVAGLWDLDESQENANWLLLNAEGKGLPVVESKANPNHRPAGDEHGGEFAPSDGGGAPRPISLGVPIAEMGRRPAPAKRRMERYGATARTATAAQAMVETATWKELDSLGMGDLHVIFHHNEEGGKITALDGIKATSTAAYCIRSGGKIGSSIGIYTKSFEGREDALTGAVRHEAFHVRFAYADRKSQRIGTFLEKNQAALEREDGTTSYSKAWWQRATTQDLFEGRRNVNYVRTAVNESLAEMHKMKSMTPTYKELDNLVNVVWSARKGLDLVRLEATDLGKPTPVPGLIELPGGACAAMLDEMLNLTTNPEQAAYLRVLYPDGRSIFGIPTVRQ